MQKALFGDSSTDAEPIVMSLYAEYYDLIWQGLKRHEFRRRFLSGTPTTWFVYLNAPVSRLCAVIDLGPAIVDTPEKVAAIAERTRVGNGASVLEYVQDLEQAYAIPILSVREYKGLSADDLRDQLGSWHPPQSYMRLRNPGNLDMLRICEKLIAEDPLRQVTVHHP
ncbi:hypothetical protein [Streptosporangium sp. NBC_01756]|uniref:hypothetical protein n=1 Tax=Streptosporangium sp. NBC_01756 TaxID=2975950 RepID=UPI002DD9753A|nr:hypothetical protein [Streptosporangium sp. NBC_01756]WSC84609.1 hypothetical protein OIE48_30135 [Streptosporangium sp. NBC_01756]